MNYQEWLACTEPGHLLKWLQKSKRHRPTLRKLGLFAYACAGRLGGRVRDEFTISGLDLAERLAEGNANQKELRRFHRESVRGGHRGEYTHIAIWAVRVVGPDINSFSPETSARSVAGYVAEVLGNDELPEQCRLLREVLGNPFRSVSLKSAWLTWNDGTIPKLAKAIYDKRAFDRLPILTDALEEAGCTNQDILTHCRQPGEHVRGCWAVDLLLGKE
jgi:hypothetical protein